MANDKSVMTTVPGSVHASLQKRADYLDITLREYLRRVLIEDANFNYFYGKISSLNMPNEVFAWLQHPELILNLSPSDMFKKLTTNIPDNDFEDWSSNINLLIWLLVQLQSNVLYASVLGVPEDSKERINPLSYPALTSGEISEFLDSFDNIDKKHDDLNVSDDIAELSQEQKNKLQDIMFKTAVSQLAESDQADDDTNVAENIEDTDSDNFSAVFEDINGDSVDLEDVKSHVITAFGSTKMDLHVTDDEIHSWDHVWMARQVLASIKSYYVSALSGIDALSSPYVDVNFDWLNINSTYDNSWIIFSFVNVTDDVCERIKGKYGKTTIIIDLTTEYNRNVLSDIQSINASNLTKMAQFKGTSWVPALYLFGVHEVNGKEKLDPVLPRLYTYGYVNYCESFGSEYLPIIDQFYGISSDRDASGPLVLYDFAGKKKLSDISRGIMRVDLTDPYNQLSCSDMARTVNS